MDVRQPTDKQINCVNIIVNILNISPPSEFTLSAYSSFISEHMAESYKVSNSRHLLSRDTDDNQRRLRAQRESDWQHTHCNVRLDDILSGKVLPPSWSGMNSFQYARHLRSLGMRTIEEEHEDTRRGLELFSRYEY